MAQIVVVNLKQYTNQLIGTSILWFNLQTTWDSVFPDIASLGSVHVISSPIFNKQ